jgi:monothiol glutaredoxin
MTNEEIRDFIQSAIDENRVMLFMKGTPEQPACGFSMRTAGALNSLGVGYAALDVLPDPRIRQELSAISEWPTIPQLFVEGKLVGGCDIVTEMHESGELAELVGVEQPTDVADDAPEGVSADPGAGERAAAAPPLGLENRLG